MLNKKIKKTIITTMLTSCLVGGLGGNVLPSNIQDMLGAPSTAYAFSDSFNPNKYGLRTDMGWVTSKVTCVDSMPDGVTLTQMKAKSIKISPETHPQYFQKNPFKDSEFIINTGAMNLTDETYYWSRWNDFAEVQEDYFIKMLSMKPSPKDGAISKDYTDCLFSFDEPAFITRHTNLEISNPTYRGIMVAESETPVTPPVTPPTTGKNYTKSRLSGNDRYSTALAIAKEFNGAKLDNVIISSGSNFPDSLSGSVLAKKYNAPILLVGDKAQSNATVSYIKSNLKSSGKIYILGGTGVVTNDVVNSLKDQGFNNFERLGGLNRIDTNLQIVDKLNVATGTNIVISDANGFADSLSVSSIASVKGMPIMLVQNTLESKTIAAIQKIKPTNIYIVGGTGAVSSVVENQLKSYGKVTRIGGLNRYETSINIAKYFNPNTTVGAVATGTNFADALAGSTLAAKYNAPVVLVDDNVSLQKKYIDSTGITKLYILGGTGVVSDSLVSQLVK